MSIQVEVSVGEFLDKLTILEIKSARIKDIDKLNNINNELQILRDIWAQSTYAGRQVEQEIKELRVVNEMLWDIEDDIRDKEANNEFDQEFVELARSVYITNDKRAMVKKKINQNLGSDLREEKSYTNYVHEPC